MLAPIINVAPTYKIDFMVVNLPQTPEGALEPLRFEWFMNKKIIKNLIVVKIDTTSTHLARVLLMVL